MNPNFGTVVPSNNRAVVDKGDFAAEPRGRCCGAHSCDATSNNYNVKFACGERIMGQVEFIPSEIGWILIIGRWKFTFVFCEIDCITASIESGEISQPQCCFKLLYGDFSGILPIPFWPGATKRRIKFLLPTYKANFPGPSRSLHGEVQLYVRT